MRRKLASLILFAVAFWGPKPAHSWIFEEVPDKNVSVRYKLAVAADVSTAAVVVDLSNTTSWPHTETRALNVSAIRIEVDKTAASTATVKLGVMTLVDSATGSVTWFAGKTYARNVSNTDPDFRLNYAPNFKKLKVIPGAGPTTGTTPYLLSNDTTLGSTTYQTDVNLPSPVGNTAPGIGDIVISVANGTVAIEVYIELEYHAEK